MAAWFKEGKAAKIHQNLLFILLFLVPLFYWMLFQMCLLFKNNRMHTLGTGEVLANLHLVTQEGSCDLLGCHLQLQKKKILTWCHWGALVLLEGGAGRCNVLCTCDFLVFWGFLPASHWCLLWQWTQLLCLGTVPCWGSCWRRGGVEMDFCHVCWCKSSLVEFSQQDSLICELIHT